MALRLPLERAAIEAILPHRDPFLLLDRVTALEPGVGATAERYIDPADPLFRGHFPGHPLLPGVLQVEMMAQTGALTVLSLPQFSGKLVLFAKIEQARFRAGVSPGELLELSITMERLNSRGGSGQGQAKVEGKVVSEGKIFFVFADPPLA